MRGSYKGAWFGLENVPNEILLRNCPYYGLGTV